MTRRQRRATSPQGVLAVLFVLGGVLTALSILSRLLSASPALTGAGLALVVIGAIAAWLWLRSRLRLRANTLADLLTLTPTGFEQAVAHLLHDLGYRDVRRSGGAGDLNVDIWCRDQTGRRIAVQCKRYSPTHRVGSPEVQTFIGMIFQHHGADEGMFVTTSAFTGHALRLAHEHRINPVDGEALSKLMLDARARPRAGGRPRPRLVRAPVIALALPLGMVLLGAAWMQTQPRSSLPSPLTNGAPAATATPASHVLRVGNTNGQGAYLRRTPALADHMNAYPDGTQLQPIGPDVDAGGTHWRHVATPDGAHGYVPAQYAIGSD